MHKKSTQCEFKIVHMFDCVKINKIKFQIKLFQLYDTQKKIFLEANVRKMYRRVVKLITLAN